jgi:DNA polymerase-3 subunit epsilon
MSPAVADDAAVPAPVSGLADGSQELVAVAPAVVAPVAVAAPAVVAPVAVIPAVDAAPAPAALAPLAALALDSLRVVVFDVETTGTDRRNDQVIELGVQLGLGEDAQHRTWRFRPDVPIHPGAQAVHGISMADLEGCPSFRDCVDEIAALFDRVEVIIGYNIAFDIDMLQAEYERAGKRALDFSGMTIVDAFRLWQQCEPRSLQHAHQRFVGDRFTAAHSASADVAATGRVLTGMLRAFGLEQQDWGAIAGLCDPQRATWIGPTRHLRWEAGVVVMGFGKHAGSALHKIAHGPDRSFLRWVLDRDFPPHVVEICRAALELAARAPAHDAELAAEPTAAWVRERFGAPPEIGRAHV